jgi:predicted dehydrogenase
MKPLKIGIIGYGKIAADQHVPRSRCTIGSSWPRR